MLSTIPSVISIRDISTWFLPTRQEAGFDVYMEGHLNFWLWKGWSGQLGATVLLDRSVRRLGSVDSQLLEILFDQLAGCLKRVLRDQILTVVTVRCRCVCGGCCCCCETQGLHICLVVDTAPWGRPWSIAPGRYASASVVSASWRPRSSIIRPFPSPTRGCQVARGIRILVVDMAPCQGDGLAVGVFGKCIDGTDLWIDLGLSPWLREISLA
jgi:hypothetical protein